MPFNHLDILLVLVWVQTVCKVNQQTTKVAASRQKVKGNFSFFYFCVFLQGQKDTELKDL